MNVRKIAGEKRCCKPKAKMTLRTGNMIQAASNTQERTPNRKAEVPQAKAMVFIMVMFALNMKSNFKSWARHISCLASGPTHKSWKRSSARRIGRRAWYPMDGNVNIPAKRVRLIRRHSLSTFSGGALELIGLEMQCQVREGLEASQFRLLLDEFVCYKPATL